MEYFNYMIENSSQIIALLLEHVELTVLSLILSVIIGIPIGILISYIKPLEKPVLSLANIVQAIPSMALLGFTIPFLGIGTTPAIAMVVLYSLLPIIKNTYTGIRNINEQTLEAAVGIGLTKWQVLTKIQIPLALPVIMAGVRISAVSAVGLMTLAAFVGAGGLGYLVYAGIRSVNNAQILAGAIPACLLALFIDYIAGIIENLVTPKVSRSSEKIPFFKKKSVQITILTFTVGIIAILFATNLFVKEDNNNKIIIGSMDFTEQEILSYLVKYIIEENTDIEVEQKLSLGSSTFVLDAINADDIDMYIEYTGTIYGSVLKKDPNNDVDEVYEVTKEEMKKRYNLTVLEDLNFNNTYTLAVTKETQEKYNLKTISDLSIVASELIFSPTLTFMERNDCYIGLKEMYSINFKDVIAMDGTPRYFAVINDESQVVDAYSTDALLKEFDLVVLEDDKNFFLPYHAIPIVNENIMNNFPQIISLLEKLGSKLSDDIMRELNYLVDTKGEAPKDVAYNFLKDNSLI